MKNVFLVLNFLLQKNVGNERPPPPRQPKPTPTATFPERKPRQPQQQRQQQMLPSGESQYSKTLKGMQESNKKVFVRPVPAEINKVNALRQYFSQAGQVLNVECFPDKNHAIIEFSQKV